MIEFTALAIACGMFFSSCVADSEKKLAKKEYAQALVSTVLAFISGGAAVLLFVVALATAPWRSL